MCNKNLNSHVYFFLFAIEYDRNFDATLEILKLLLKNAVDLEVVDLFGHTPL